MRNSEMGLYLLGSSLGLLGLGVRTVALRQIVGILHLSKVVDIYWHSHLFVVSPACKRNSGWISSGPGALPTFMD